MMILLCSQLVLLLIILLVAVTPISSELQYKLVKVHSNFSFVEEEHKIRPCYNDCHGYAVDHITTLRMDGETRQWNLKSPHDINRKLNEVYDSTIRPPVFKPEIFLSHLRNRRMGILGDSLGFQLFEGLAKVLSKHATTMKTVEGFRKLSVDCETKIVEYESYNSTLFYCDNPFLVFDENSKCSLNLINSHTDVVVIAVGAWFKPKFHPMHEFEKLTYNQSFDASQVLLKDTLRTAREFIKTRNPRAQIIWRLHPHVGCLDEWVHLHNRTDLLETHVDGLKWSNVSLEAHWVPVYNDIIRKQAKDNGDPILDWYTLSHQYINYFARMDLFMHIDTLHYCSNGLPRGAALPLQDILFDIRQKLAK